MKNNKKCKLIFEGIITLISMIFMFISFFIYIPNHYIMSIIMFFLAIFLVFYLELDYFKTYKQIKNFDFTMDFLIAIATHITFFYSLISSIITICTQGIQNLHMEFWEIGYELSFFIGLGHLIEDKLKIKTSLGIKDLLKLQNKNVLIKNENKYIDIKSNKIKKNDIIKILKSSTIPTDGILISKNAYLDYSSLLGETIPRELKKNDYILSGAINVGETIIYKATKPASESTLIKIINQLEQIMMNKSKIEITSQKIVKYFLPSILLISLFTFIMWITLSYLGINLPIFIPQHYNNPFSNALYHAVATLVIACPCAFGIAAPAAIYSSSFIASKNKIIFSSPKIYETVNNIKYIAFDKTGTITKGEPIVIKSDLKLEYASYVYNLVTHSHHPLSNAIKNYLKINKNLKHIDFKDVKEIPGIGIVAKFKNNMYSIVSLKYAKDNNFNFSFNYNNLKNTVNVFAINKNALSYFEINDEIKNDAKEAIDNLHKFGFELIILSGDKKENVEKLANYLSIDYWYGELLPMEKSEIINQYKKKGNIIFVGDGVNDILAIKSATIGIAYSSGSDITNSIADISLLKNDLNLIYKTIVLAKRTLVLIKINFIWATIFNLLCIPLAIIGLVAPWLGSILMISSTSFLLINTLFFQHRNKKIINKLN